MFQTTSCCPRLTVTSISPASLSRMTCSTTLLSSCSLSSRRILVESPPIDSAASKIRLHRSMSRFMIRLSEVLRRIQVGISRGRETRNVEMSRPFCLRWGACRSSRLLPVHPSRNWSSTRRRQRHASMLSARCRRIRSLQQDRRITGWRYACREASRPNTKSPWRKPLDSRTGRRPNIVPRVRSRPDCAGRIRPLASARVLTTPRDRASAEPDRG